MKDILLLSLIVSFGFTANALQSENLSVSQLPTKRQVIATSQTETQQVIAQEVPTTVVEAAPLIESRAERLRKQREAAEMNTELMIVEQLEKDRIEAERKRVEKLFGNKLQQEEQVQPVVVATPVPTPVYEVVEQKEDIKQELNEIKELLNTKQTTEATTLVENYEEPVKDDSKFTISVLAGAADFPDVNNVDGIYSLGFAVGMEVNDGFIVEGSYTRSTFEIDSIYYPGAVYEMNQNQIAGAIKYKLLTSRVSPVVGLLAAYTMRDYSDKYYDLGSDISSQSIDLGISLGAELSVRENFSVNFEMKYLMNVSNKIDDGGFNPYAYNGYGSYPGSYYGSGYSQYNYNFDDQFGGKPVEELDQLIIGIGATLKF